MIEIKDKTKCCGCTACSSVCPKHCINMVVDDEGFLYPSVNAASCVDCGQCERVCPFLSDEGKKRPLHAFAAKNTNDVMRANSCSSGGLFTLFAEKTINDGGVVFGVQFDENWNVVHGEATNIEDISKFRGSKYVQSNIGDTYVKAKEYLKQGRKVLFSGTSCQIMGLKKFLGKDYPNLLTIDVICHGVPSPAVWKQYLKEVIEVVHKGNKNQFRSLFTSVIPEIDAPIQGELQGISFRDKTYGWRKNSFALLFSEASAEDEKKQFCFLISNDYRSKFFVAFNDNLILRSSCFNCPAKGGRSGSDVTLADFWGIENVLPDFSDDIGVSLCICNTTKGYDIFQTLDVVSKEVGFDKAIEKNQSWHESKKAHPKREKFYCLFKKNGMVLKNIEKCKRPPFIQRQWMKYRSIIKRILQLITK